MQAGYPTRRARMLGRAMLAPVLLSISCAHADAGWQWSAALEQARTGGWVQVRENTLQGTRLDIPGDLGAGHLQSLRLGGWRPIGTSAELHLGLAIHRLQGSAVLGTPVLFNGTTIAPGPIRAALRPQDFLTLDAHMWWLLAGPGERDGLWASLGLRYEMLNFRLHGTIAADSVGHETKEDFYVQELPVPMLGLHLSHALGAAWCLTGDLDYGRLPWVNSLRREGGLVKLSQTEVDARLGLDWDEGGRWAWRGYVFHDYLCQAERSREDGNVIHLRTTGIGLEVDYRL